MFITRKHLSRRTMLRGAGAAIALPLLDAMVPAATSLAATAAARRPRLAFVYFPHGAIMEQWTPAAEGRDFPLSPILTPLKDFQHQLTVISNLGNPVADGPVHSLAPATWLSCTRPQKGREPNMAPTCDQIAALAIGQDTPMPSLEIAAEVIGGGGGGTCDRDFGCSYTGTISFRTASTPLPMEYNPRKLFQRLFGRGDTPEERAALTAQYGSVLDTVAEDAASLTARLGPRDRSLLGDYMDTVRELERRTQKAAAQDFSHLTLPQVPVGIPENLDEYINLMFDMAALAWQANLTRIINFMIAAEVSARTYNNVQVPDAFHAVSHHGNDPEKKARLVRIQTYHTQQFAKWLTRLAATEDGDGSLLDNAIILYGSNMSNSDAHNHYPLPTALLGGGCGKLRGNQHLRCPERTPMANALVTLLDRAGVPVDKLGDSTGSFPEV